MKKFLSTALIYLLCSILLTAQEYKIKQVDYNIQGCGAKIFGQTQDYILAKQIPVNTTKVFESKSDFEVSVSFNSGSKPKTSFTSLHTLRAIFFTPDNSFESQTKERELVIFIFKDYSK